MSEAMFRETNPDNDESGTEEAAVLEEARKLAQQFTVEGSPEIKGDIPAEKFGEAIAESIDAQIAKANKEGGRRRVGRVAMAALSLISLMTMTRQAEAGHGGYVSDREGTNIMQKYYPSGRGGYRNHDSGRHGGSHSWGQVGRELTLDLGLTMLGGGPSSGTREVLIEEVGATKRVQLMEEGATDRTAIEVGRGVPYDARPGRQAPPGYVQQSGADPRYAPENLNQFNAERSNQVPNQAEVRNETAPDTRTDIEKVADMGRAYKAGNEDGQSEFELAKSYGAEHPVLTKGRWQQIVSMHQNDPEPDSYFKGFVYSWSQAGGTVDVR